MNFNCKAGRGCWTSCCAIDAAGPPQPTAAGAGRGAADAAKVGCRHAYGAICIVQHPGSTPNSPSLTVTGSPSCSALPNVSCLEVGRPVTGHWAVASVMEEKI